jgi:hypothetical protein
MDCASIDLEKIDYVAQEEDNLMMMIQRLPTRCRLTRVLPVRAARRTRLHDDHSSRAGFVAHLVLLFLGRR